MVASALLEGESHPEAYEHLASCSRCRLLVAELGAIEQTARTLPAYEPNPRLWVSLKAAAAQEGLWRTPRWHAWPTPFWTLLPLRPAAVGVLGLVLGLAVGLMTSPTTEPGLAPATAFEVARGELVQEANYAARYQVHLKQVETQVLAEERTQDAALRQLFERPLGDVDHAIARTQLRLESYPNDGLAQEELRRLYQQKAVVLQAMSSPVWMEVGR